MKSAGVFVIPELGIAVYICYGERTTRHVFSGTISGNPGRPASSFSSKHHLGALNERSRLKLACGSDWEVEVSWVVAS